MTWTPFELDRLALEIVLDAKKRDVKIKEPDLDAKNRKEKPKKSESLEPSKQEGSLGSLNQVYKMRAACTYGLERFWGEHLRLAHVEDPNKQDQAKKQEKMQFKEDRKKAKIIIDTWLSFVGIMKVAGIHLPNTVVNLDKGTEIPPKALAVDEIEKFSNQIWNLSTMEAQISLSVLTSFCDSIVWWTQRLKLGTGDQQDEI